MTDAASQREPSGLRPPIAAIAGERATRASRALDGAPERTEEGVATLIGLPELFPHGRRR